MNILIIGGTRFIGAAITDTLAATGHHITVFHRGETDNITATGVDHLHGERQNLPDFRDSFARLRPDVVLDMMPLNETDARLLTDTFRGLVSRIVAIGSMDVYLSYGLLYGTETAPVQTYPLTEDSPLRTSKKPHGDKHDKISVEKIVMNDPDFRATCLRLPMVYGPNDRQHRLFDYMKRMDDGRPAIILDDCMAGWRWTRGYVANVAAAIAIAVTDHRAAGNIYNIGEAETISEAAWVARIADAIGWSGDIVAMPKDYLPDHLKTDYHFEHHLDVDTGRFRRQFSFTDPVTLDDALKRTIAWERNHPPEKCDPADFDYAAEDDALKRFLE